MIITPQEVIDLEEIAQAQRVLRDFHKGQIRANSAKGQDGKLSQLVALMTQRRWGKTEFNARRITALCWRKRGAKCAFIAQQKDQARDLLLEPMERVAEAYGWKEKIHWEWNKGESTWTWIKTGSTIKVFGADEERFARLLRGRQFDDVTIDEAQSFMNYDLKDLCNKTLLNTISDRRGRMFMCGTPGDFECYYKEVVCEKLHPQWATVYGEFLENPATAEQIKEQITMLKMANPLIESEPWFQREYMGIWVPDVRRAVCKIPEGSLVKWGGPLEGDRYSIGASIGPDEPGAIAVAVSGPRRKKPIICFAEEHSRRKTVQHLETLQDLLSRYSGVVVAKQSPATEAMLEDLACSGIPIEDVNKNKMQYLIDKLSGEVAAGNVHISDIDQEDPSLGALARHWGRLVWIDNKAGGRDMSAAPHLTEACALALSGCTASYKEEDQRSHSQKEADKMLLTRLHKNKDKRLWR